MMRLKWCTASLRETTICSNIFICSKLLSPFTSFFTLIPASLLFDYPNLVPRPSKAEHFSYKVESGYGIMTRYFSLSGNGKWRHQYPQKVKHTVPRLDLYLSYHFLVGAFSFRFSSFLPLFALSTSRNPSNYNNFPFFVIILFSVFFVGLLFITFVQSFPRSRTEAETKWGASSCAQLINFAFFLLTGFSVANLSIQESQQLKRKRFCIM